MKVLWVTNIPLPEISSKLGLGNHYGGSWMYALLEELKKENNIELAIASPFPLKKMEKEKVNNVHYYILPLNYSEITRVNRKEKVGRLWESIIEDFNPDLIHIHGTEYSHGLNLIENYKSIPSIISIQGILEMCKRHFFANIPYYKILLNRSIMNYFFKNGTTDYYNWFKRGIIYEKQYLDKSKYVIGRTDWDKAYVLSKNNEINYFHCDEVMRPTFFNKKWCLNTIDRYSILVANPSYPLKGFHYLLEAVYIAKKIYPEILVKVVGVNNIKPTNIKYKLLQSEYEKYINKKIKKLNLESNILFVGGLDEEQMANQMQKSHIVCIPSSVENGSNMLSEAMIVGTPCIASTAGGMSTTATHKQDALLYNYYDYEMLANYIIDIFSNDDLAVRLSNTALKKGRKRNDSKKITKDLLGIYHKVYCLHKESQK